jgi:hypothetical protein
MVHVKAFGVYGRMQVIFISVKYILDYSICPLCKKKFCLKCRNVFHIDITCEEATKLQLKSEDDLKNAKDVLALGCV